jgi:hypothetical protein
MSTEKSSLRNWFFVGLFAELAAVVLTFANAHDVGIAIFAVLGLIVASGLVVAAVLSWRKPRYRPAVIWLWLHVATLASYFGYLEIYEPLASKHESRKYWRQKAETRQQQAWRGELEELVVAGKLAGARAFVLAHEELRLDYGAPFTHVLCPPDKKPPDLGLLRLMEKHGAPAGRDLLVEAAKCSLGTVKAVMSLGIPATATSGEGRTALTKAQDRDLLEFLVGQGVKVDARDDLGRTALMFHRTAEVTRFLLAHGADPRAKDNLGRTALHHDGPRDQLVDIFLLLLEAGADPNARSHDRETPLLAHRFYEEVDELLISHGADWRNGNGASVLYYLVEDGYFPPKALKWPGLDLAGRDGRELLSAALASREYQMVQKLLDLGANPTVRDPVTGKSPLDSARLSGWNEEVSWYRAMRQAAEHFDARCANGDAGCDDAGAAKLD